MPLQDLRELRPDSFAWEHRTDGSRVEVFPGGPRLDGIRHFEVRILREARDVVAGNRRRQAPDGNAPTAPTTLGQDHNGSTKNEPMDRGSYIRQPVARQIPVGIRAVSRRSNLDRHDVLGFATAPVRDS